MVTGDGAYIKKINRSIILKEIIEHKKISRAGLSKNTGLNKATISVQVADLIQEGLIYETHPEHNVVGRRPIMLSVNNEAGYVLGIDLDYKQIQFALGDLSGNPVHSQTIALDTDDYDYTVQVVIKNIKDYIQKSSKTNYGLISVTIGVHGTVNKEEEIYFIPKYQWRNKKLKTELAKEVDLPIYIENNANLSSYAEKVYKHHDSQDLLTIILTSGIGAGLLVDGNLYKGYHGFAGEMGHMIVTPNGHPCTCGNDGCWEKYASEPSLLKNLGRKLNQPAVTYEGLRELIAQKDPVTLEQMEHFLTYLALGLNNVINIYNPETLVLNSKVLEIYPESISKIKRKLVSSVSQYREIVLSELGYNATVMGACAFGLQHFFEVTELILDDAEWSQTTIAVTSK